MPPEYAPPAQPFGATVPPDQAAVRRSWLRVVGCTALSFSMYNFWWFYVTRKQLSRELGTHDRAGLQTLGQFVPILNFVIAHWLWRDVSELRRRTGLAPFEVAPYTAGNVVATVFGLQYVVYALILEKLNQYFDRSRGGRAPEAPFTTGEILVTVVPLVLGGLFVTLIIVSIFATAAE